MYRIRKLPNREEYCIYSNKGKLKYKTTRRDLARRKLKSLLMEFWVNNTENMENPIVLGFSEMIRTILTTDEDALMNQDDMRAQMVQGDEPEFFPVGDMETVDSVMDSPMPGRLTAAEIAMAIGFSEKNDNRQTREERRRMDLIHKGN